MEIFLNGKMVGNYGVPAASAENEMAEIPWANEVLFVVLDTTAYQQIDVLYSNFDQNKEKGFRIEVGDPQGETFTFAMSMLVMGTMLAFLLGGSLSFVLNHLLLFFFFREDKSNLFYGIAMLTISILMFTGFLSMISTDPPTQAVYDDFIRPVQYGFPYALLLALYAIFYRSLGKWHFGFLLYAVVAIILEILRVDLYFDAIYFVYIVVWLIELFRVVVNAIRFKKMGSKYIGIGIVVFTIGVILMIFLAVFFERNADDNLVIDNIGFLALFILISVICIVFSIPTSMSLFIGQKSAITNRSLKKQLRRVEDLSAKTLQQEREKQQLLEDQKSVLENEVKRQTQVIVKEKELTEEKNKEITDSIVYAKRIQEAILPPLKLIKDNLKNCFILYKPKDIVAGDFYWMESVGDTVIFAAADCTGHGVPGAMVSVVCSNALNRSVREFGLTEPAKILDKTLEIVIERFEKSEEDVKDGMDIALCALNTKTKEFQYAGANNPLWVISKEGELSETKATKQPIGKYTDPKPYENHVIALNQGDSVYVFSDGYPDQFGGEKGKKLKTRAFKELLLSIQDQSMNAQRKVIDEYFETWRGDNEQIDDVCVIGVRV